MMLNLLIGLVSIVYVVANQHEKIVFKVLENMQTNTVIGDLKEKARELGISESAYSQGFSILQENVNFINLNKKTGIISTTSQLDRERVCPLNPEICEISFIVAFGSSDFIDVVITIEDINDKSPTFSMTESVLGIPENSQKGLFFPLPIAEDKDSKKNGISEYRLGPSDQPTNEEYSLTNYFELETETSPNGKKIPKLKVIKPVDREEVSEFSFRLIAVDYGDLQGSIPIQLKIIDVNDNPPHWIGSYRIKHKECDSETTLVTLQAEDKDDPTLPNGQVTYHISEESDTFLRDSFYISQNQLRLSSPRSLQNMKKRIEMVITAKDGGGLKANQKVIIDVLDCNDHKPEIVIKNRSAAVYENTNTSQLLSLITVTDLDGGANSEFECRLSEDTYLQLNLATSKTLSNGGRMTIYSLKTRAEKPFDRESMYHRSSTYLANIRCEDNGPEKRMSSSEVFRVNILDINDNAPRFQTPIRPFYIDENEKFNMNVGTVVATDDDDGDNKRLSYHISEEGRKHFSINNYGKLTALESFDREKRDIYKFAVIAKDHGAPPKSASVSVTVIINDINDCTPVFVSTIHDFSVEESYGNQMITKSLGRLNATDQDSGEYGQVSYNIRTEYLANRNPRIQISSDGMLSLIGVLDREVTPSIRVVVIARDNGRPSLSTSMTVTVHALDVNDNKPVFRFPGPEGTILNVSLTAEPNSILTRIRAEDPDYDLNGTVQFSLYGASQDNANNPFALQPNGDLILVQSLKSHGNPNQLVIKAEDKGSPLPKYDTANINLIYTQSSTKSKNNYDRHGMNGGSGFRRFSTGLVVFYLLASLLLAVFLVVCGVLIYLYIRTRTNTRNNSKRISKPVNNATIMRRDSDTCNEAMLTLKEKVLPGNEEFVSGYNDQENNYTHLTAALHTSPNYGCVRTGGEHHLYTYYTPDNNLNIESPYATSWERCDSPMRLNQSKAATLYTRTPEFTSEKSDAKSMTSHRPSLGGGQNTIKAAHSYAFLDNFSDSALDNAKDHRIDSDIASIKTSRIDKSSFPSLKSPYVTSSFV